MAVVGRVLGHSVKRSSKGSMAAPQQRSPHNCVHSSNLARNYSDTVVNRPHLSGTGAAPQPPHQAPAGGGAGGRGAAAGLTGARRAWQSRAVLTLGGRQGLRALTGGHVIPSVPRTCGPERQLLLPLQAPPNGSPATVKLMNNYMGVGIDAQCALQFHMVRGLEMRFMGFALLHICICESYLKPRAAIRSSSQGICCWGIMRKSGPDGGVVPAGLLPIPAPWQHGGGALAHADRRTVTSYSLV